MKRKPFMLILLTFSMLSAFGQDTIAGKFTMPLYELTVYPNLRAKDEFIGLGNTSGQMRYHAFYGLNPGGDPFLIDTLLITRSLSDDFIFSDLTLTSLPSTEYPSSFCHVVNLELTYPMKTSSFWLKVNSKIQFRYIDFQAKMIVQDLGIHQARLINRLGKAPKDHLVERPVRVLYVLEFLELKGACEPLDGLER